MWCVGSSSSTLESWSFANMIFPRSRSLNDVCQTKVGPCFNPPKQFGSAEDRAPGGSPLSETVSRPTMASEADCVRDAVVRFLATKPRADALQQLRAIFTQAAATVPTVMQLLAEVCHTGLEPWTSKLQTVLLLICASPALDSTPTTCSCMSSRHWTTILSMRSSRSSVSSGATPISRRGYSCTSSSGCLTGAARDQAPDRHDVSRVAAQGEHGVYQSSCCQAILSP